MIMIESYRELPLGKYIEVNKISRDESLDELERQVAILAVLCDMTEDEVLNMPIMEYKECARKATFLEHPVDVKNRRFIGNIKVEDWTLKPTTDIRDMTTAQYVDFQEFTKEGESNLANILSCLLVPKGYKYNDGYDITELQGVINRSMSTDMAVSLSAFFLRRLRTSIKSMLTCCRLILKIDKKMDMMEKNKKMVEIMQTEHLLKSGDGLGAWIL